jgi:SAM-dependent methyltransferase
MLISDIAAAWYMHLKFALGRTGRSARALIREHRLGLEPMELRRPEPMGPTDYATLAAVAGAFPPGNDDVFVDLGCGKGRPLCFMAQLSFRRVVGVERSPELAAIARRNAERMARLTGKPVRVELGDAADFRCDDGTVYFLNNPFGPETLKKCLAHLRVSLDARPRQVRIAYYLAVHGWLLDETPWLESLGRLGSTDVFLWRSR